jgi:hypothetical protein
MVDKKFERAIEVLRTYERDYYFPKDLASDDNRALSVDKRMTVAKAEDELSSTPSNSLKEKHQVREGLTLFLTSNRILMLTSNPLRRNQ